MQLMCGSISSNYVIINFSQNLAVPDPGEKSFENRSILAKIWTKVCGLPKHICLVYVLMTDYLYLQTFVMHSQSGAE